MLFQAVEKSIDLMAKRKEELGGKDIEGKMPASKLPCLLDKVTKHIVMARGMMAQVLVDVEHLGQLSREEKARVSNALLKADLECQYAGGDWAELMMLMEDIGLLDIAGL